jgi:hypothetical protein
MRTWSPLDDYVVPLDVHVAALNVHAATLNVHLVALRRPRGPLLNVPRRSWP